MDKRKLVVFILCCVCIFHLSSQAQEISNDGIIPLTVIEKEYLANNSIKMCVDPDWLPYEQLDENKNHIGMIADYYKLIQKAIGKQIQIIPTASWKETLNNVRIRKCDIVSTAAITEERKEYVTFTKPYMVSPIVIATRNNEVYISSLEEVLDKTFAAIKDYSHIKILREKYPSIKIIEVNNVVTGLEKVSNGEVYGFMDAIPSIAYEIQRNSFFNLKISGSTGLTYDLSIAVRNDDPILLGIMQKAIDSISSHKHEEIANKWISVNYVYGFDYSLFWKIIVFGVLLLVILIYWNSRLKKEILERKNAENALLQSKKQLKKSNQQLKANNQQLEATEQQLRSVNHQLEANNQQLIATEQQLRASNQQLDAMNQQLEATNQQLIENTLALKESEETYRLFAENSLDVIWSTDKNYNMTFVNKAIFQFLGYTPEEVLAMHPKKYTTAESFDKIGKVAEKLLSKFEFGEIGQEQIEVQQIKKDGSIIDVEFTCNILCDDKGEFIGFQGRSIDITKRNEIEAELLKMDKLKSIGTLAGGIAHDFNNILTGIYGNVSLALMEMKENHPSYEFLVETEKSISRASKLTRQLLTFAKGGSPVKKEEDLTKIIKETVIFDLSGSNVKPVFNFAENLMNANIDKSQMEQVFSNLTINANQASPEGGHLYVSVTNSFVKNNEVLDLIAGEYLKITVRDEGTGIPKKYIDKIFDPYFTTKETGNGLGLATTYSIIKKHKGYLGIDSEFGKGTTFVIYLPASRIDKITNEEKFEKQVTKQIHSAKILVMDDEEVIRKMSSQMIRLLGYEVDAASDGKKTITKYKEAITQNKPFDIVILDLTIPGGMGGKETLKKILEIDKNAKVIVSSGYTSGSELADYKALGFVDMIDKPYTMTKLKEVLVRVLNN